MDTVEIPVPQLSSEAPNDAVPLAAGPEQPKRRRRRRTRAEMEAEQQEQQPEQQSAVSEDDLKRCKVAMGAAFNALSSLMASKRGTHWRLSEEECAMLGDVWGLAIAPYLPKIGGAVPWATALVVTWSMAQPRLEQDATRARLVAEMGESGNVPASDG